MDKKKFIYVITGIMGGIILLIVIFSLIGGGKKLSYKKIENKMISAAESYFEDNENSLPKTNGESVTVDSSTLVNGGYMKQLSDMVSSDVDCTGKVIVSKSCNGYLYSPILKCGDKYQTKTLVDVVTTNNPVVTSGDGLYLFNNVKKFKGEYINNYVQMDGKLWRILDIDSEGYMRLIYADKEIEETYVWDDRYNIDKDKNVGINNYEVSRIKETMTKLEADEEFLSEETKTKLAYRNICIGKRSEENLEMNIDEECETVISNQLFGLPYVIDYVSASTDVNCKDIDDESCENYNYLLNSSLASWTLNGQKEKSYRVFAVNRAGYSISDADSYKNLRPTVYLNNNVLYDEGTGTKTDPYIIK